MTGIVVLLLLLTVIAGIIAAAYLLGFRAGRALQVKESLQSLADLQQAQAKAAAAAPRSKDELLSRLKNRGI